MKSPRFSKTPPNHAAGASLLEVLVTVVLLSVGLLGIAGTQTIGLKNVANASLRTQASVLAYDIVDRMRANRIAAEASLAGNLPQGDGAVAVAAGVVTVTLQWIEREGANGVMHTFQFNTRL